MLRELSYQLQVQGNCYQSSTFWNPLQSSLPWNSVVIAAAALVAALTSQVNDMLIKFTKPCPMHQADPSQAVCYSTQSNLVCPAKEQVGQL